MTLSAEYTGPMAAKLLLDQATLLSLLRYEPETGKLFWRERTPEMFKHTRHPEDQCRAFNNRYAGREGFTALDRYGYAHSRIFGQQCLAHRLIWVMVTGHAVPEIDHENGRRSDNRWGNLRDISHAGNHRNRSRDVRNRSGHSGVVWREDQQRWHARVKLDGRDQHLGSFTRKEDAIEARKSAERRLGFHPNHGRAKGKG